MFSDHVKNSTLDVHQKVEKKLIARIKNVIAPADYRQLLHLMYGFYRPIEDLVSPYLPPGSGGYSHHIRKSSAIIQDLAFLETLSHPHEAAIEKNFQHENLLPVAEELPTISNYATALGVLYVIEGSTLGGVIIAGMISKKLGIPAGDGFSFFNGYGEQTRSRWEEFKKLLSADFTETERSDMLTAALSTFTAFDNWISIHESAAHQ